MISSGIKDNPKSPNPFSFDIYKIKPVFASSPTALWVSFSVLSPAFTVPVVPRHFIKAADVIALNLWVADISIPFWKRGCGLGWGMTKMAQVNSAWVKVCLQRRPELFSYDWVHLIVSHISHTVSTDDSAMNLLWCVIICLVQGTPKLHTDL